MFAPIQGNAVLGLAAALLWGGGDFAGGMGVKRFGGTIAGAMRVILIGHSCSLLIVAAIAYASGDPLPHGAPLLWGLCGGVVSGLSLMAFYIALSSGAMGAAAAVSGLLCATVPAVVSAMTEGRPEWTRVAGFLLAGAAIWLIAAPAAHHETGAAERTSSRAMWLSIAGGIGFGFYFVSLKMASGAGVLWPMATARVGSVSISVVLLAGFALTQSRSDQPRSSLGPVLRWTLAGATLDTCGNLLFIAATRAGRLDVAAVLASLYPASTILLAAWLLRETTTRRQTIGMLVAIPAVALITL